MQVIGFTFSKISGHRQDDFKLASIDTNIEFIDIVKEKIELLKEKEAVKINFQYTNNYKDTENKEKQTAEIHVHGHIVLAVSEEESKNLLKSIKEKIVPPSIQIPLFNLIIKKCTPKAISMADELALPSPVPIPTIKPKTKESS